MIVTSPLWSGTDSDGFVVDIIIIDNDGALLAARQKESLGWSLEWVETTGKYRYLSAHLNDFSFDKIGLPAIDVCNKIALQLAASDKSEQAIGARMCAKALRQNTISGKPFKAKLKNDPVYILNQNGYWLAPGEGYTKNITDAHKYAREHAENIRARLGPKAEIVEIA